MTAILTNPRERTRFLRFAVVGILGAVVDFGVANVLTLMGMNLAAAGAISFFCAILSNFTWNHYWTYPDSNTKPLMRQLAEFSLVSIVGLAIRLPILKFLAPVLYTFVAGLPLHLPVITPEQISNNLTLAVAVVVVMFWNFFVNRYWTYGDVK
ncbi:MAG TPA: GtrA family protein [Anaerolineales bacterium]|nr:GtrA family protein [Anaerolineales bacterium]